MMKSCLLIHLILFFATGFATETYEFDEYEVEDLYVGGCDPGFITNNDYTCSQCTPGTFADTTADPPSCHLCPYDTYSGVGATECSACSEGLGTLEQGSILASDCIAVCEIPRMTFVARTTPESRIAEGGNVVIDCSEGYHYGNAGRRTVSCSSSTSNFPASCRRLTISSSSPSVKSGDTATVICKIEASDVGAGVQWFKDNGPYPIESEDSRYNIVTTIATTGQEDGITMVYTSTLSIFRFSSVDVASYSCRVSYNDPIRDDSSTEQSLSIVDLVMAPAETQILSATKNLEISCVMNIDEHYVSRDITWQLSNGDNIYSGVTTSTNDAAYFSVLYLSNIALTDAGTYTCSATYSLSDRSDPVSLSKSVDVIVRGFETHPADQIADVGSEITLSCAVIGDRQATISWTSSEIILKATISSTKTATVHSVVGELTYEAQKWRTSSTLTFTPITSDHNGVYKCSADFGGSVVESASATIIVKDFGIVQDPTSKTYFAGEDATLTCIVKNSDASPTMRWYKSIGGDNEVVDDTKINFDDSKPLGTSTLTLTSATIEDAGEYTCEAVYVIAGGLLVRRSIPTDLHITPCEDTRKSCRKLKKSKKKLKRSCKKSSWEQSCPATCGVCTE